MNRAAHQLAGGVAGLAIAATAHSDADSPLHNPLVATVLGAMAGRIPDILEPASHPHHRQFFHSVTVAAGLGIGVCQLWQWRPETDAEKLMRTVLLIGGAAWLSHLLLDSSTPRGLPLVGHL